MNDPFHLKRREEKGREVLSLGRLERRVRID
jgi:hypothetical protein